MRARRPAATGRVAQCIPRHSTKPSKRALDLCNGRQGMVPPLAERLPVVQKSPSLRLYHALVQADKTLFSNLGKQLVFAKVTAA